MHISDGVLSAPVWIGGFLATLSLAATTTRRMNPEEIPKVAVMISVFFVASLVHVPFGPTSVHLLLNGLAGIILGPLAFVSILLGLILQALLFQHGGMTTIGVNTVMMGLPAFLAYKVFNLHRRFCFKSKEVLFGTAGGVLAVLGATIILALFLVSTGSEFIGVARYAVLAHLPVMVIEGVVTSFVVSFLMKVKPEILKGGK